MLIEDFDILHKLGEGGLGKVFLVKKKSDVSGRLYAMKLGEKYYLKERHMLDWIKQEKEVSSMTCFLSSFS